MNNLGNVQSIYKSSRLVQFAGLFTAAFFFLIFGIMAYGYFFSSDLRSNPDVIYKSNPNVMITVITVMFFILVPLLLGLLFVWIFIRTFNDKLVIYENGLCFTHRKNSETVFWDEIESVYEYIRTVVSRGIKTDHYFYAVRTKDYREIIFSPHLKNNKQVGERLKLEAEKRKIPIIWGMINETQHQVSPIPR